MFNSVFYKRFRVLAALLLLEIKLWAFVRIVVEIQVTEKGEKNIVIVGNTVFLVWDREICG